MKIGSSVLATAQKPMTIFGMPFKSALIALGLAISIFVVLTAIDMPLLGFLFMLLFFIGSFAFLAMTNKKDCHWEKKKFHGNFLKGQTIRTLKAGQKPKRFQKNKDN